MKPPSLFVVAHDACSVNVVCMNPGELRRIEPGAREGFVVVTSLSTGAQDLRLPPGLYHLSCQMGVSCKVTSGSCSVMLAMGEDPWPTPPPPQFNDATAYETAAVAYLLA
jgi:hypothetical protein